jgi:hypothetical protein
LNKNFGLVGSEPSFLELPADDVVSFVESHDLEVEEEDVFAAVVAWVKKDEAGRKVELDRLLPLVRFPFMKEPALAMEAEPLVAQHPQAFQLVVETHQDFAKSARAAGCPRLVPRKGTKPLIDLSWMCTTDEFQGFRKMTACPTVALAVSQSNELVPGKVYDAPVGWHWATRAEVKAVPGWRDSEDRAYLPVYGARRAYNYGDQGGWDLRCIWEGVERCLFFFREEGGSTAGATHVIHAGNCEGKISKRSDMLSETFAGIVCIQDSLSRRAAPQS